MTTKLLFNDAFKFADTHGLSLSDQHHILSAKHPDVRINLYQFALDAAKKGWSTKKILNMIKDYCSEHKINIKFETRERVTK